MHAMFVYFYFFTLGIFRYGTKYESGENLEPGNSSAAFKTVGSFVCFMNFRLEKLSDSCTIGLKINGGRTFCPTMLDLWRQEPN